MQAHADEQPAVSVRLVEIQADALVVFRRRGNVGEGGRVFSEFVDDLPAQGLEIAALFKAQPRFRRFLRFGKVGDEVGQRPSRLRLLRERDEQPRDEVCPVVEKIIFFEGGVPARFDGERGIFPRGVAPHRLVDNVFVAALVAAVFSAVRLDEFHQSVARDRIGDDGARLLFE